MSIFKRIAEWHNRLLCRLSLHDWHLTNKPGSPFYPVPLERCATCGLYRKFVSPGEYIVLKIYHDEDGIL